MRVAINAQLLNSDASFRGAGVSNYSRQLLLALARLPAAPELTVFLNDRLFQAPGLDLRRTRWPAHRPLARILWEQTALPLAARRMEADLLHGLVNVLPLAGGTPGVVTVHDLSFLRLPDRFPRSKRIYLSALCRASVGKASRVLAVSRQTANDLLSYYHVDSRRVEVVYNGVSKEFRPLPVQQVGAFRQEKGLPERFLLYLGTLEPRKNLPLLLQAYGAWRATCADGDATDLVLAGAQGWGYQEIYSLVEELALTDWVHFPGFVPADQLPLWYNAAAGFVYPSLYEGFGLPVLEAMACGTPVICSDAPSLLEVAGEAALVTPATEVSAWVSQFQRLFQEPDLVQELREAGLAQARRFSWEQTALQTQAAYVAALGG